MNRGYRGKEQREKKAKEGKGCSGKASPIREYPSAQLDEVNKGGSHVKSVERAFQAEERRSKKHLRQKWSWSVPGTVRMQL